MSKGNFFNCIMRVKNGLTHFIWTNHLRRALTWCLKSPEINLLTSGHKTTTLLKICLCCMSSHCLFRKDKHLQKWAFTDDACLLSVLKQISVCWSSQSGRYLKIICWSTYSKSKYFKWNGMIFLHVLNHKHGLFGRCIWFVNSQLFWSLMDVGRDTVCSPVVLVLYFRRWSHHAFFSFVNL